MLVATPKAPNETCVEVFQMGITTEFDKDGHMEFYRILFCFFCREKIMRYKI